MAAIDLKTLQTALATPLGVEGDRIGEDTVVSTVSDRGSSARRGIVDMMGGYFEERAGDVDSLLGGILGGRDTAEMTGAELLAAANRLYEALEY